MLGRTLKALGHNPRVLNRGRIPTKLRTLRFYDAPLRDNLRYLLDPELQNFTYELENEDELARWIADTFTADHNQVCAHLIEARSDQRIYARLRETSSLATKREPALGRRLGWYAITRLLKPRRVLETGIHDGIGTLVFLAALDRNADEGHTGELVSFDIEPSAGWLVGEHPRWSRRIGDSQQTLPQAFAEGPADLFLHDSLHTIEHETFELEAAATAMGEHGVILSDNSHATPVLREVAQRHGRTYAFFRERPRAHFHPGCGIGAAL
jgi:predicted O-methyltransferase YrrM